MLAHTQGVRGFSGWPHVETIDLDAVVGEIAPDDQLGFALAEPRFKDFVSARREVDHAVPCVWAIRVFDAQLVFAFRPFRPLPVGRGSDEDAFVAGVEEPERGAGRVSEDSQARPGRGREGGAFIG